MIDPDSRVASRRVPLRCAVVGIGQVARRNYLPELVSAGHTLAFLGRTTATAIAAAESTGGAAMGGYDELAAWRPDVVFVLTTDSQHHEVLAELIEHAVPRIFVEKPLVAAKGQVQVDEGDWLTARRLIGAAEAAGIEVAMGFNYRFFDLVQRAQRLAQERSWGPLVGLSARTHFACWSHTIDLLLRFGGPIAELSAFEGAGAHGEDPLRAADRVVTFVTESGAAGTLHGTGASSWNHDLLEISAQYEGGRFVLHDLDGSLDVADSAGMYTERIQASANGNRWERYDRSFSRSIAAYLASVGAGESPPVPGRAGLDELQVEAAIATAIRSRVPVKLAVGDRLGR